MAERPHRKLVKCHVLFLGDSTPEHSNRGLESLQQPLMKCYPVDNPTQVEATKCVNYIDGKTGRRMDTEFVDINNSAAERSSHPPLFSITVRKTSGKRVLRCYTFLVRDEEPAVMMVDAAKYAFTHESGWSNSHPPEDLIRKELVAGIDDPDDVDQFDSVSTAGKKPGASPGNQSQSDSDIPDQSKSRSFPAHLVKKYTLTNPNRGLGGGVSNPPTRRPIPTEFMPAGSLRSGHHGIRIGPPSIPPYMMNGNGGIQGSVRTTSSVRIVRDPRSRTSILERVIRQEVPVPVPMPVYQPPPPPKVIHQVRPVYVPQPPEIRHVPVEREVPVPVEVPVPYPITDPQFYNDQYDGKRSHRHKSHKHKSFKNYQVYDDRFTRRESERSSFFVNAGQPYNFGAPPNGHVTSAGERYRMSAPPRHRSRGRRDFSSSDSESSEDDYRHRRPAWEYDPYSRRAGDIEIVELHSPDETSKSHSKSDRRDKRQDKDYHIRAMEKDANGLNIREVNNNGMPGPEFKWSAIPSASTRRDKEEKRAERRSRKSEKKSSRDDSYSPSREQGQVYIGADAVGGNMESKRSSYHVFRQNGDQVIEELKEKKKGKKKREKSSSRVEEYPDYNGASTSKEYYFKEHTENPPRNWMDQKKEYMNERAFSSSLANDPDSNITNAYALNREPEDDTMLDRTMPGPPSPGDIPVPPPLPTNWETPGGNAASLY